MTIQRVAELLNGREVGKELVNSNELTLGKLGIVVVFGASDDLMEIRGAISDEFSCYDGGTAFLTKRGLFKAICEDELCPHETFDIMENGEKFCKGIVFKLEDIK